MTVADLRRAVDAEVQRSWSDHQWTRWLDAAADLRGQQFRNVVLIKLQMPDAVWVDGRTGWQRQGRRVVRGASGIRIVASGQDVDRHAGPVQGHGVATVWDFAQTEGRIPSWRTAANMRVPDVYAALTRVAADAGYRVDRGALPDALNGATTDRQKRRVTVSDELEGSVAAMSLAHELAHLRMHKLSRDSGCHGLVRLEAESVAYLTLARFGALPVQQMASAAATLGRRPATRLVETLGGRVVAAAGRLIDSTERYLPTPRISRHPGCSGPITFDAEDRELNRGL
ncbi:hypothetical protein AB0L64_39905 [Kribbella sp. NPDC051936]|uniref:hypothetical protein n=1 Tax=Kribbella sp. NPDC051936 TaxID=3154946 RepID=UPI00344266C6